MSDILAKDFEYTLPEGYVMEQPFREKLDALVEEAAISNKLAQKFIDLHVELTEDFVKRLHDSIITQNKAAEYSPENSNL